MMQVADVLVGMRARGLEAVCFSGGEPLVVKGLLDVIDRLAAGGLQVTLNTSGYGVTPETARRLAGLTSVHISVDGADAQTHDRVRGRPGSFERALRALTLFDDLSRQRVAHGEPPICFGIDMVVLQSTFAEMPRVLTEVASRYPALQFVFFDAVIPEGFANRESYRSELLTEQQLSLLNHPEFSGLMRTLAGPEVRVAFTDSLYLQNHPERGDHPDVMSIEPDGEVRALPIYGGTIGNILVDDPSELWKASVERREHPTVVGALSQVRTMEQWAVAIGRIERSFASADELVRIGRRESHGSSAGGAP